MIILDYIAIWSENEVTLITLMSIYSKTKTDRDMRFVGADQASPGEHFCGVTSLYLILFLCGMSFTEKNISQNTDVGILA